MNQYVFAATDPINFRDPSGAMATDAQGSVCSINATSCGDALGMPGPMSAQAFGAFGGRVGDVSYGRVGGIAVSGGFAFGNDANHILRDSWLGVRNTFVKLADQGDMLAQIILRAINSAANSPVLFLFENADIPGGHYGQTPQGMELMLVNVARIQRNTSDVVTVASTMIHEFGHASYQFTAILYDSDSSDAQALSWDNAYRRTMGMALRPNHGTYPQHP
ncbi:MAG: hypothetical protein M3R65_08465 [Gemmatimonadota bacterium]|nr:hypothetical protein [Gemmatimonadota bacterium]